MSFDASDEALAIWFSNDGTQNQLQFSRFSAAGGWASAQSTNVGDAYIQFSGLPLAVAPDGSAFAVWSEAPTQLSNPTDIRVDQYIPDTGWGAVQSINSTPPGTGSVPQVVADGEGGALVIWGGSPGIYANQYVKGTGWLGQQTVDAGVGANMHLTGNLTGEAMVAWLAGGPPNTYVDRFVPGSGWSGTEQVSGNYPTSPIWGDEPTEPAIATDSNGDFLVAWQGLPGMPGPIYASRYSASSGWDTPQVISAAGQGAGGVLAAMNADGDAIVAWSAVGIHAQFHRPQIGWSGIESIPTSTSGAPSSVAIDSQGNAFIAWAAPVTVVRYEVGVGWGAPVVIDAPGGAVADENETVPELAVDSQGNALAVWCERPSIDTSTYTVYASYFH